jgi:hypothetical protein
MGDSMPPMYLNKEWFWRIDEIFATADGGVYQAALDRLQEHGSIVEVARSAMPPEGEADALDPAITEADLEHFADDWAGGGWWKDEPIDEIMRAGMIVAISTAMELGLPLETMWLHGGPRFQVYVVEGRHQVTAVVYSPRAPSNPSFDEGAAAHLPVHLVRERNFRDGEEAEGVPGVDGVVLQRWGSRALLES